jgi:quercetin dioxygenase-like cupin family protein
MRYGSFPSSSLIMLLFNPVLVVHNNDNSSILQGKIMSTAAKAEVLILSEMVAYQAGSVVSRQVVKTDGGNVTLFAFDAGQELSEHTTPFDALVHVLDGKAEIKIAGQEHHLQAGEAIIMPANQPHAVKAVSRFQMLLTMIKA